MDYTTQDIINLIEVQAIVAQVNPQDALRIAFLESSLDVNAKNANSSASGLFQFTFDTFMEGVKKRGLNWAWDDVKDPWKNINMALWYMQKGEFNRWESYNNYYGIKKK